MITTVAEGLSSVELTTVTTGTSRKKAVHPAAACRHEAVGASAVMQEAELLPNLRAWVAAD